MHGWTSRRQFELTMKTHEDTGQMGLCAMTALDDGDDIICY